MAKPWIDPEDRFGRNLRRQREAAGLSQSEVAERLKDAGVHLHPSAIAKIEARDVDAPRSIRLNEAAALARVLGCSLPDLLAGPSQAFEDGVERIEQAAIAMRGVVSLASEAFESVTSIFFSEDGSIASEVTIEMSDLLADRFVASVKEIRELIARLAEVTPGGPIVASVPRVHVGETGSDVEHQEAP